VNGGDLVDHVFDLVPRIRRAMQAHRRHEGDGERQAEEAEQASRRFPRRPFIRAGGLSRNSLDPAWRAAAIGSVSPWPRAKWMLPPSLYPTEAINELLRRPPRRLVHLSDTVQ
jgi:hypothetical protein